MWLLVLGLFALGCAAAAEPRRGPWIFQLDADSPMWGAAVQAAADWAKATGLDVRVAPDGNIPILQVEHLSYVRPGVCDESTGSNGCSFKGDQARIEILSSVPAKGWRALIAHEMGHELRGDGVHLEQFGNLMAASQDWRQGLTPEDIAFICQVTECTAPTA